MQTNNPEGVAPGFEIAGGRYPIPQRASFTMDEAEIMWDITGYAIEDFAPDKDGEWTVERIRDLVVLMRNPRFRRALMHVAYRRGNPAATYAEISEAVGNSSDMDSWIEWLEDMEREDEENPPSEAWMRKPTGPSPSSEDSKSNRSGDDSTQSSDAPVVQLAPTGTGR